MEEKTSELYQNYLEIVLDKIINVEENKEEIVEKNKSVKTVAKLKTYTGEYRYFAADGKKLSTRYKVIKDFNEGFAAVQDDKLGWNFIDEDNNLISDDWYDKVRAFSEGYAAVYKIGFGWNFIDSKGNLLCDKWNTYVEDFNDGYAIISPVDSFKDIFILDKNGKTIKTIYPEISFRYGLFHVTDRKKIGDKDQTILGFDGKPLLKWYASIDLFSGSIMCLDKLADYRKVDNYTIVKNKNFISFLLRTEDEKDIILDKSVATPKVIDLSDYKVRQTLSGYRLKKDKERYDVKFKPIKVFDSRYTLCMDGATLYLYDRFEEKYLNIGYTHDVTYDDNCIYNDSKNNEKTILIYNQQEYDITNYYKKNLKGKKFNIKKGFELISKDDFFVKNINEIKELIRKEKEQDDKIREASSLQELKEKDEESLLRNKEEQKNTVKEIETLIERLEMLENQTGQKARIKVKNLFVEVGDHKEIKPMYLNFDMLKHIDLSLHSFNNVKIDGIDFRGCNIDLKPQEVYMKNLSNCNFEGMYIQPFTDFTDVDIRGTKFSNDNNHKTIYDGSLSFKDAIYDQNTTYNGISFVDIYGECNKNKIL